MVEERLQPPVSHYLLDANASRKIDQRTIEEMYVDGFTLMETAGYSAAHKLLRKYPNLSHGIYLCGKGNNAGDALVTARYLLQHDISGSIIFLSGIDSLSEDTQKNFELLQKFDDHSQINVYENWEPFESSVSYDFIVDGMLGTGLNSELRGDYQKAAEWTNNQGKPVFAMDIPTGLHPDTGEIMETAINATNTFAFGGLKQGFYLKNGPSRTGRIYYCELPFPNHFKNACSTFLLDEQWLDAGRPQPGKHKYESGVLYIIAGSEGLTGAAIMAAKSAWAEGLGAVILICPRGVLSVYEHTLPAIIKKPVGTHNDFFFTNEHTNKILEIIRQKTGKVLLGPGLGRADQTVDFVHNFLGQNPTDIVIDADGLWCLAQQSNWHTHAQSNWILTPHRGELNRLVDKEEKISSKNQRLQIVHSYASLKDVAILSKGMPGIIGTSAGNCYLTNYDTRYFARAGSGDVLAGKVSAYFSMNHTADRSCALALLNGKKKLTTYLNNFPDRLPEPADFI